MVIEGVQEELELEAGSPLKQAMLVASPTKRSKPNVSTIFKEAGESFKQCERGSLIFKDIVLNFSESMKAI